MDGEQEFAEIFEAHYDQVVAFFRRWNCREEESRDLANETFLRAYRGFESFRKESQPATWLNRIARHILLNHIRAKQAIKRDMAVVSLDGDAAITPVSLAGNVEAELIFEEELGQLREWISLLPPRMRKCVELRLLDHEYHDIAEIMGLSVETVKSHLHQATAKLKTMAETSRGAK